MQFHVDSYTREYINKTKYHLYIKPAAPLQRTVAHYTITFPNYELPISDEPILQLIPDVSGCFVFDFAKGRIKVWGPTTKVVGVANDLNTYPCRFFVEFLPGGLYQVFGRSIREMADQEYELKDLNHNLYDLIQTQLTKITTFDELVDLMDELLCQEIKKHPIEPSILDEIEHIYSQHVIQRTSDIAQKLGISERQLNRCFNKYIGLSVKKFSKIVTINHLIKDMNHKNLLDLTFDYSYFDQAHFNHVFKEICETTPTEYIENLSDFYYEFYKF